MEGYDSAGKIDEDFNLQILHKTNLKILLTNVNVQSSLMVVESDLIQQKQWWQIDLIIMDFQSMMTSSYETFL